MNKEINVEVLDKLPTRPHQEPKLSYVFKAGNILYCIITQGVSVFCHPVYIEDGANEWAIRETGLTIEELLEKAEELSQDCEMKG